MRELTKDERETINTLKNRGKLQYNIPNRWKASDIQVRYERKRNFTLVEIFLPDDTRIIGAAKLNNSDRKTGLTFQPQVGERIAFVNALTT